MKLPNKTLHQTPYDVRVFICHSCSVLVSLSMARTLRAAPSGLRIAIRLLTVASRRSIKRLQQTVVHTSKLVRLPAADPQPRWPNFIL
jgi:hypothetical protein